METNKKTPLFHRKNILAIAVITLIIVIIFKGILNNLPSAEYLQTFFSRIPYIIIGNQENWTIKGGFAFNIFISLMSMILGSIMGCFLGLMQIAKQKIIHNIAWILTQFFRNSPWLVILFVISYNTYVRKSEFLRTKT